MSRSGSARPSGSTPNEVFAALRAGAAGYLVKHSEPAVIIK
ncbi:MAG: hypothetical protein ACTH2Q_21545 [Propionibacteriaceae bacterium]